MDPEQVLIDYLCHPSALRATTVSGMNLAITEQTIRFLAEKEFFPFRLYLVEYETSKNNRWQEICLLEQGQNSIWAVKETIGTSEKDRDVYIAKQKQRIGKQPWVLFSGGTIPPFWGIGRVITSGDEVARIHLTDKDQHEMESSVLHGYALFLSTQNMQKPIAVELYSYSGAVLGRQTW